MTSLLVDDVKRARGEDEIVATDLGRVAGPVRALDDAADAAEHAAHRNHAARDGSSAGHVRHHQAAVEPLAPARPGRAWGRGGCDEYGHNGDERAERSPHIPFHVSSSSRGASPTH